MKMPPRDQPGERYSQTVSSSIRLIEKHLSSRKRQTRCMNDFFLYGFCSIDAFHQSDLFSNSVKRVIRKLPDSLPDTCEGPSKEIDKKFLRMKGHFGVAMT
jgi:hypothetical protein